MSDIRQLKKREAFLKEEVARNRHGLVISRAEFSDMKKTELFKGKSSKGLRLKNRRNAIEEMTRYLNRDEKELKEVQEKIGWLLGDEKKNVLRRKTPARQRPTPQRSTSRQKKQTHTPLQPNINVEEASDSEWMDPQG